ncbi:hypothetical protein BpOF4_21874 (plasmid) [Alkalihalophilus pseudofirmus OF4]|uniref:HTH merR-type domain-containing protein n=1 Tax=Alkalihalophilus pseudofirmus (strain ATCC BAA-2126 / JCM 17055 / OF4) TaxID=398511 RepID=D3G1Z4_ALKPO|nr:MULTISPECIES: hypothetical protein [Alkalihalophilus]ADC52370.1 hypothetical protein BpOF4_21874 [Alkalihalophilus pseudofirmus OF4]MED1603453.1 hypothetical protein [Alkalihalophilus marmarensis]
MVTTLDIIETDFSEDPLKRQLELYDVTAEKLYPSFLNNLHPETTYSTTESAAYLQKNDSTLRNYLRNENLMKYIQPVRSGRFYRLNYRSIYRLYLILMYLEQGKTISDIEVLLGYRSETVDYDPTNPTKGVNTLNNEMLGQILKSTNKRIHLLEQENKLSVQMREYDQLESQVSKKKMDLELIDHKISLSRVEVRNQQLLTHTLKKATKRPKSGFFQSLFGKEEEVDVDELISDSLSQVENVSSTKINDLENQKEDIKRDLVELEKELIEKKASLSSAEQTLMEEKRVLLQEGTEK